MQMGDVSKGTEYFQKAAEASPERAGVRTQLAISKLAQGQTDDAEADLEVALDVDKDATQAGESSLSLVRLRKGEFDDAAKSAEQLRKSLPDSPLPFEPSRRRLSRQGRRREGARNVQRVAQEKGRLRPRAHEPRATRHAREQARPREERIQRRSEDRSEERGRLVGLASVAVAEKNPDQAVQWYNRAIEAEPRNVPARMRLINYYAEPATRRRR